MWRKLSSSMPKKLNDLQLSTPIEFQSQLDKIGYLTKVFCPYCGGSGKLYAMQSVALIGGGSVRGSDTIVKCNHCRGTGRC